MSHNITPLFVFSLPRSGSTLLQRSIAAHPRISTAAEPWLMLPLIYTLRREGSYAEYSHYSANNAMSEFVANMPGGRKAYNEELRHFVEGVYGRYTKPGDLYFLDKTPRYHLIVDEIIDLFPDAKFVFLWRNPLAVIASTLHTFGRGKWRLHYYCIDFFKGFESLHNAYLKHRDRVHTVNYEDFLCNPETETTRLFRYLGIEDYMPDPYGFSSVKLDGTLGDPIGTKEYTEVSKAPLEKWRESLCNPIRRAWSRRYLDWIGPQRLADIGYDHDELSSDLRDLKVSGKLLLSDTARIAYGAMMTLCDTDILTNKFKKLYQLTRVYPYT